MAQHNNDILEEMRKQRENEKKEKHAQYVSRGIPENIISTLESGKLKKRTGRSSCPPAMGETKCTACHQGSRCSRVVRRKARGIRRCKIKNHGLCLF